MTEQEAWFRQTVRHLDNELRDGIIDSFTYGVLTRRAAQEYINS